MARQLAVNQPHRNVFLGSSPSFGAGCNHTHGCRYNLRHVSKASGQRETLSSIYMCPRGIGMITTKKPSLQGLVAQPGIRASGSYPQGRGFKSLRDHLESDEMKSS